MVNNGRASEAFRFMLVKNAVKVSYWEAKQLQDITVFERAVSWAQSIIPTIENEVRRGKLESYIQALGDVIDLNR